MTRSTKAKYTHKFLNSCNRTELMRLMAHEYPQFTDIDKWKMGEMREYLHDITAEPKRTPTDEATYNSGYPMRILHNPELAEITLDSLCHTRATADYIEFLHYKYFGLLKYAERTDTQEQKRQLVEFARLCREGKPPYTETTNVLKVLYFGGSYTRHKGCLASVLYSLFSALTNIGIPMEEVAPLQALLQERFDKTAFYDYVYAQFAHFVLRSINKDGIARHIGKHNRKYLIETLANNTNNGLTVIGVRLNGSLPIGVKLTPSVLTGEIPTWHDLITTDLTVTPLFHHLLAEAKQFNEYTDTREGYYDTYIKAVHQATHPEFFIKLKRLYDKYGVTIGASPFPDYITD